MAIHNAVRTSVTPASRRNRPRHPALKSAMDEAERLLEIERLHLLDTPLSRCSMPSSPPPAPRPA